MKAMDRSNVTRSDIEKILLVSTESRNAQENLAKLQGQLLAFAALTKTQFEKLRGQGIRMEFES